MIILNPGGSNQFHPERAGHSSLSSDGKLKSQMFSILEEYDRMTRSLSNEDYADYILTHPTVFTEDVPSSGSLKMEDLTEKEYFAEKTMGQAIEGAVTALFT